MQRKKKKKKRAIQPSNSTHLNNNVNLVRFNVEVANVELCGWPWKIGVWDNGFYKIFLKSRTENFKIDRIINANWMHALI